MLKNMKAALFLIALAACGGLTSALGKYSMIGVACCPAVAVFDPLGACRRIVLATSVVRLALQETRGAYDDHYLYALDPH